jgi:hypothetical protein
VPLFRRVAHFDSFVRGGFLAEIRVQWFLLQGCAVVPPAPPICSKGRSCAVVSPAGVPISACLMRNWASVVSGLVVSVLRWGSR